MAIEEPLYFRPSKNKLETDTHTVFQKTETDGSKDNSTANTILRHNFFARIIYPQ